VKNTLFLFLISVAFTFLYTIPIGAQISTGNDIIIIRAGYIYFTDTKFRESNPGKPEDVTSAMFNGYAGVAEYNINFTPVLFCLGVEYQRLTGDIDNAELDGLVAQFFIPQATLKWFPDQKYFYLGTGISLKYNFDNENTFKKEIDTWINIVLGFMLPLYNQIQLDLSTRIGYNITNLQWSERTKKGSAALQPVSSEDIFTFYIGFGYKLSSN